MSIFGKEDESWFMDEEPTDEQLVDGVPGREIQGLPAGLTDGGVIYETKCLDCQATHNVLVSFVELAAIALGVLPQSLVAGVVDDEDIANYQWKWTPGSIYQLRLECSCEDSVFVELTPKLALRMIESAKDAHLAHGLRDS